MNPVPMRSIPAMNMASTTLPAFGMSAKSISPSLAIHLCRANVSPRTGPFQKLSANDMVQPSISAKLAYLPQGSRYGNQAMTNKDRDRVLQLVEQLGIPIIDVHQAFSSVPDPLIYFSFRIPNVGGAGHYTEQGYKVIARQILRCIEQRDLLNQITRRTTTCPPRAADTRQGSQHRT